MPQFAQPSPTVTQQNADSIFVPVGYVSINASDSQVYTPCMRGLWVGTAGNVAVVDAQGNTTIIVGVLGGTILPGYFQMIKSTNTTATNLVAIY